MTVVPNSGSGAFADKTVSTTAKGVTITGFSLQGGDAGNYVPVQQTGVTAFITAKSLTISGLTGTDKTYDRLVTDVLGGTAVVSGLTGDDVTVVPNSGSGVFADKTVSTTAKGVTITGFSLQGGDAGNYVPVQQTGVTAFITPKSLTISGLTGTNKTYDRLVTDVLGGTAVVSGVTGDDVTVVPNSGSGVFADKTASTTAKGVTITGFSLQGGDAGNYVPVQQAVASAFITPKSLTVTGVTTADRTYDATTVAVLTGNPGASQITGDDVTVIGTGVGRFAFKDVGPNKAVTVTGYSLTGGDAGNYAIQQPSTLSANVTPAAFSVTGLTATPRTYDTTTSIDLTGTAGGIALLADAVTVVPGSGTGTLTTKSAGVNMPLSVAGLTLAGADSGNYTVTAPILTATIYQANLPITGLSTANRTYDSTNIATFVGNPTVAQFATDVVTVLGPTTGTFNDKTAALGKAITATGFTFGGADGANYHPVQPVIANASISRADLSITGLSVPDRTYNASTVAVMQGSPAVAGLGTDDVSVMIIGTAAFADKNIGQAKAAAVIGFAIGGVDAANYNLLQPSTLAGNITPYALQIGGITVNTKIYDTTTLATLAGTATVTPLATDVVTVVSGLATAAFIDALAGYNKPVIARGYTLTGADALNYTPLQPAPLVAAIYDSTADALVADKLHFRTSTGYLSGTSRLPSLWSDALTLRSQPQSLWAYTLDGVDPENDNSLQPANPAKGYESLPAGAAGGDAQQATDTANGDAPTVDADSQKPQSIDAKSAGTRAPADAANGADPSADEPCQGAQGGAGDCASGPNTKAHTANTVAVPTRPVLVEAFSP